MAQIEYNDNITWEQVLYFLEKKDKAIESKVSDFWGVNPDGSLKLGVVYYLEKAIIENDYITEIEVPMKKNESNLNYDVIKLVKNGDSVTWFLNNIETTKEELRQLWTAKDIAVFEKNLAAVFEKLHEDRNKTLYDITISQDYLKRELNARANKCVNGI